MIGKTISHYKILEEIGSGGMGVVYKAEDTKLKRTVALKFLPPEFSRDKEAKKRFLYEAQAAAAIEHPNICPVHEINEDDGQLFIAMSYMDGQTLMDRINQGPIEIEESLKIITQIAEGLNAAHKKEIVHRDIKSANIILTDEGVAKILDFGLAKLRGQTKLTKESTTLGTIAYMSPEQTTGEEVDQRTDIWSLGVVLYEMLTGKLPFRGHYEQAIMYSIMNEEPEPIKELMPDIPIQLEQIINNMLVKDPKKRYSNLGEFLEDLKRFRKGKELKDITTKPKSKITTKSLVLGIFFLVVIIIVTGYFIFNGKPGPESPTSKPREKISLAIMYFENNSGDEGLDNWRSALAELIITDLSQSRYIRVLPGHRIFSIFKKLNLLESKKYSSDDLKAVANQGRVNHILKGSYIKAGENFVITSMLQNMSTGEVISSLKVEARGAENIFPKVDELTREIKLKLNLTRNQIDSDIDKDVANITTSFPEAYKFYIEARRNHYLGRYRQSFPIYEKAVAVDPEFALAYADLGIAYFWFGSQSKGRDYLQKALDLSDRVSDRERYLIQGTFYLGSEKTYDKSFKAFNKLLELYPDDNEVDNILGATYTLIEEWEKAIELFISCIQREDEVIWPYFNLSLAYRAKGLYDKAKEVLENYLNNVSDNAMVHNQLALTYLCQERYDLALVELNKALAMDPANFFYFLTKGDIYICRGDLIKAEKEYQKVLELEEKVATLYGSQSLAALYLSQGRFKESEEQLKQGISLAKEFVEKRWESSLQLDYTYRYLKSGRLKEALKASQNAQQAAIKGESLFLQIFSLHLKGIVYLEMKSMTKAHRAAAELKELIESGINKKAIRYYHHLMGKIELKRKNFSNAVELFKKGISLLKYQYHGDYFQWITPDSHALFMEPLALAYYKMGDLDRAQQEYEKITSLSSGRIYYGDIYARSFYLLGQIYEEKGWKGKAIENYNKFVELWKNCDPEFRHLVEDARKRVKELEGKNATSSRAQAKK